MEYPTTESTIHVRTHRCGSWWCEHCCHRRGAIARGVMIEQLEHVWVKPMLLTLTVDRAAWPAGAHAVHSHVTENALIPRLMRRLGIERWVWVLEFQSKTGEGWPHWHLLIDVPSGFVDFTEIRRLWLGSWNIGGVDVKTNVPKAAMVWYLTGYLTKTIGAMPRWVLESEKTVRKIGTSKCVGSLMRHRAAGSDDPAVAGQPTEPPPDALLPKTPAANKPTLWRIAECGTHSRITINGIRPAERDYIWLDAEQIIERVSPGRLQVAMLNRSVGTITAPIECTHEIVRELLSMDANAPPIDAACASRAVTIWGSAIGASMYDDTPLPLHGWGGYAATEDRRNAALRPATAAIEHRTEPKTDQTALFEWRESQKYHEVGV